MNKKWISTSAIILMLAGGLYFASNHQIFKAAPEEEEIVLEEEVIEENLLYGININELDVIEGVVGKNQTLSTILAPFNVPYQIIDEIAQKSKDIFDVRKIAFNKKFTVLSAKDSSQAQFFIYEPNPAEYVVFKLDQVEVYKEEKPVEIRTIEFGGLITKSLYQDMIEMGASHEVINKFADLYGWNVDFQRVPKGDKFKVVYREKVVEGVAVGFDGLEVAYYEHKGQEYHAIPFEQNGELTFFDQDGNSFKKEFLRDPVEYTRISSKYNLNRFHPVQKRYKPHLGTDYAA
ncbi:MAG: peptidase M23, partial [Cyclobacteriaceae bacterium]|nr:peptidase M23 [Cyclobacteriaceae bacterium]